MQLLQRMGKERKGERARGEGDREIKWENRAKMEMPWKAWNKKEERQKGRLISALKGMKSIWPKIKVVILTMQNPFAGSGIQMETTRVWFKREYYTNPNIFFFKKDIYVLSSLHLRCLISKITHFGIFKKLHSFQTHRKICMHKSWRLHGRFIRLSHYESVCMCASLTPIAKIIHKFMSTLCCLILFGQNPGSFQVRIRQMCYAQPQASIHCVPWPIAAR